MVQKTVIFDTNDSNTKSKGKDVQNSTELCLLMSWNSLTRFTDVLLRSTAPWGLLGCHKNITCRRFIFMSA
jgi:hypothetical protein